MSCAKRGSALLLLALLCGCAALAAQANGPGERRISIDVSALPLVEVLRQLRHDQGIPLAWRGDLIPHRRVTLVRSGVTIASLLGELLQDTGLEARATDDGILVLVPTAGGTDPEARLALAATGIQHLDQLIVTGSAVLPLPEREQPTAVTVVTSRDLDAAPHRRLPEQLRAFLPGVVSWDRGGIGPAPTLGAVRGVASFTARAPKVYVDGIEVASPELFTLLDGRMVRQLEMIHGPQGAALYGPDALNGVLQVETRIGVRRANYVLPRGAAVTGVHARPIDGSTAWREGAVGGEAGSPGASFEALGSVSRVGSGALPLADAWRLQGGGELALGGGIAVAVSGRAASYTGVIERAVPNGVPRAMPPLEEQGGGIRVVHRVGAHFSQTLVAGTHRIAGSREPFRSPILAPTLPLGATNETASRRSVRWAGAAVLEPIEVTLGVEASRRTLIRGARVNLATAGLSTLYHEALDSRGVFGQLRTRFGGVTLTGGARVERINSVGLAAERPWAGMLGGSWTTTLGSSALRLRGAWGKALRAPEPGMSQALSTATIAQEANPTLLAERQSGVELGGDLYFSSGSWIRLTWFRQRAADLVQQVDLHRSVDMGRTYQFQNVGAFRNHGIEFDGGARRGAFAAAARVHLVSSTLDALSPTYSGEFRVGDAPLEVPRHAGAFAVRYEPVGWQLELGANWIGPWTGYDWQLIAKVERGESPPRDRVREYRIEYSGVMRPFAGVTVPLGHGLALWGRAEAPLGSDVLLRDNLSPALGRSLLVGVEMR